MLPRLAIWVLLAWVSYSYSKTIGLFAVGAVVGAVLRQVSLVFQSSRTLPVLYRVIDWLAVDRLLDEESKGG